MLSLASTGVALEREGSRWILPLLGGGRGLLGPAAHLRSCGKRTVARKAAEPRRRRLHRVRPGTSWRGSATPRCSGADTGEQIRSSAEHPLSLWQWNQVQAVPPACCGGDQPESWPGKTLRDLWPLVHERCEGHEVKAQPMRSTRVDEEQEKCLKGMVE